MAGLVWTACRSRAITPLAGLTRPHRLRLRPRLPCFRRIGFLHEGTYRLRIASEKQLQSQHRVQEDQVKLSLFDKRFLVYLALRQILNKLSDLGKTLDAAQLLRDTNQAQFLFKPDIEEFLAGGV